MSGLNTTEPIAFLPPNKPRFQPHMPREFQIFAEKGIYRKHAFKTTLRAN